MARLPLLFGAFLALTTSGIVFMLSLLAKVTYMTLLTRTITVFFSFGILGVVLGTIIELFVAPIASKQETEKLKEEMKLEDESVEQELGDLLNANKLKGGVERDIKGTDEFKPAVFPKMSAEGGNVVSRGDSAVV